MTKVKICGLTTLAAVNTAVRSGADFLGFVFAPSKRQITPEKVVAITQDVLPRVKKVGVFVSPTLCQLQKTVTAAQLDLIQIHGEIPPGVLPCPLIYASPAPIIEAARGTYILVDAPSEQQKYAGGNGITFDWQKTFPQPTALPQEKLFVAGGLTPANVRQAIAYFQPFAVDVSSGVETDGAKDLQKIRAFLKACQEEK